MGLTIRQRADRIGAFRYVSVFLMETLARWIPTTAELEAKVLFGRHVWDFAQHADWLGRRTGELRAPLQYSCPPTDAYRSVLEQAAGTTGTVERVATAYDAVLPDLEARYREFLEQTDRLADEPSVRIIERILTDFPRLRHDREAFANARPDLRATDPLWGARLLVSARAEHALVLDRAPARTAGVA